MSTHPSRHSRRSRQLRRQASHVHPVIAEAYRRRASELELETWLRRVVAA